MMNLHKIPDKYKLLAVMLALMVSEYLMADWKGLPFTWNALLRWAVMLGFYNIYNLLGERKKQDELHSKDLHDAKLELARLHNALIDAVGQVKGVLRAVYAKQPQTKEVKDIFKSLVLEALKTDEGRDFLREILENPQKPSPQNNSPP